MKIWKAIEDDPLFHHSAHTPSLDEQRRLAVKRMYRLKEMNLLPLDEILSEPRLVCTLPYSYHEILWFIFLSVQMIFHLCFSQCAFMPVFSNTIHQQPSNSP